MKGFKIFTFVFAALVAVVEGVTWFGLTWIFGLPLAGQGIVLSLRSQFRFRYIWQTIVTTILGAMCGFYASLIVLTPEILSWRPWLLLALAVIGLFSRCPDKGENIDRKLMIHRIVMMFPEVAFVALCAQPLLDGVTLLEVVELVLGANLAYFFYHEYIYGGWVYGGYIRSAVHNIVSFVGILSIGLIPMSYFVHLPINFISSGLSRGYVSGWWAVLAVSGGVITTFKMWEKHFLDEGYMTFGARRVYLLALSAIPLLALIPPDSWPAWAVNTLYLGLFVGLTWLIRQMDD